VDPAIQAVLGFGIDVTLAYHAAESGLDMRAWAAKPVVKVEVAEGGVEVIAPQQVSTRAASAISSMLFWPSLALSPAGFCCSGGWRLPLWANATGEAKLKAATQNAARNTRNNDINGIVPPVLMEAARPLSGLLCNRIGTRLRRFPPAAPALLALKTRTLNPNRRLV
jgi:hypothetical protein